LNQLTLQSLHPKQAALSDAAYPGVFALGTRLLAYVTTSEAPSDSSDSKNGDTEPENGSGYQDLAKGVAKEVFGGVKMLGKSCLAVGPHVSLAYRRLLLD
jgi:hypothetical protein